MSEVTPPAIAYFDVADVVGERYFLTQPPRCGVRVTVTALSDRVPSQWDVDPGTAERIQKMVRAHTNLRYEGYAYNEQPAG